MSKESRSEPPVLSRIRRKRTNLEVRHRVLNLVRDYFTRRQFLEVETPLLLTTVAPEEHIVPMRLALRSPKGEVGCDGRFLATSPELQMKQLCAAGITSCFQLTRSFRAGEEGRLHSPEFTILEWYRPGDCVEALVTDLEGLLGHIARGLSAATELVWQGRTIDLAPPWRVTSVRTAFLEHAGWDPIASYDGDRFDLDLVDKVEPNLGRGAPEVLAWYPRQQASLSRALPSDPRVAQRMELYVEGLELANGFVELNDPDEQRARFEAQSAAITAAGRTPPPLPEAFLDSLAYLPDTVGIALGVDRLVMLFANVASIHEVRAFGPGEA
jgi:elongation factor P--(R)-beta-lysine ligase